MTLHDMLNWTTAGGAIVAVALVGAAWAETRRQFREPAGGSPLAVARAAVRLREIRLPARRFARAGHTSSSGLAGIGLAGPAPADDSQLAVTVPAQATPAEAEGAPPPVLIREITLRDHVRAGSVWAPATAGSPAPPGSHPVCWPRWPSVSAAASRPGSSVSTR